MLTQVGLGLVAEGTESPISNQVTPWVSVLKTRPTAELMTIWLLLSELMAKLAPPVNGHWGSGVGNPPLACNRPKVRPMPLTWKKLVSPPPQQGQKYW